MRTRERKKKESNILDCSLYEMLPEKFPGQNRQKLFQKGNTLCATMENAFYFHEPSAQVLYFGKCRYWDIG